MIFKKLRFRCKCRNCNSIFFVGSQERDKKYCDRECYLEHHASDNPKPKPKIIKYCVACGKGIKAYKKRQSPDYCSELCANKEEQWNPQSYPSGLFLEPHNKNKRINRIRDFNEISDATTELRYQRLFANK